MAEGYEPKYITLPSTQSGRGYNVFGNFIESYGCNAFITFLGAKDYTITLTSASIYGMAGNKVSDMNVSLVNDYGFTLHSSVNYAGKWVDVQFSASM